MTDLFALVALWFGIAIVLAGCAGNIVMWAREEWRRIKADSWADDAPQPCSVSDPRVARMDLKRRALGKRLRKQGRTLLAGKAYVPALTKAVEESPPKASKVVPINSRRKTS